VHCFMNTDKCICLCNLYLFQDKTISITQESCVPLSPVTTSCPRQPQIC
jgi:hypothetical protein